MALVSESPREPHSLVSQYQEATMEDEYLEEEEEVYEAEGVTEEVALEE